MTEKNNQEKNKKSFAPVITLAIIVFGIVAVLNYTSKNDIKIGKNDKDNSAEQNSNEVKLKIDVNNDKEWANTMGYLIGKQIAPTLKDGLLVKNPDNYKADVLRGIKESFDEKKDGDQKFTEEELMKIMEERQKVVEKRLKKIAEDNKKKGNEYVVEYEKKEGVEKTSSGALYKKITEGEGEVVGKNIANVKYVGKHINGEEFDSSSKRGDDPVKFTSATVLPGLGEVLELMKKGDKWEIVLPVELAYGEQVPPGAPIELNEALIFEIEVINIEEEEPKTQEAGIAPKFETVESIETAEEAKTKSETVSNERVIKK